MRRALLLSTLLIVACGRKPEEDLTFAGTVETREIQVGSKVGGRVTEVLVREGQRVVGDAPLIRFDANDLRAVEKQLAARVAQARSDLTRLQNGYRPEEVEQAEAAARREAAALEALREGPRTQEIRQAEADLASAEAEAANAARQYERIERLFESGDVAAQSRDDARARRDAAAGRAAAARERVKLLRAGTRQEDLRAGQARLEQAAAAAKLMRSGFRPEEVASGAARHREATALLEEARVRLAESEVRAPDTCGSSGCLVELVSVRPGDLVAAGRAVATLLEPSQLWVRIYVPEPKLATVSVGQRALVELDSISGRSFSGVVEQISARSEFLPRNIQTSEDRHHQVFGAKVRVDNAGGVLKSGMSANVRLEVGK